MIDYTAKLTTHRERYAINDLDDSVESDRGRILSSPAMRRLQKRTQVFALELDASIRTRLTHSLEVGQTARFIAKTILSKLDRDKGLAHYGLQGRQNAFVSTAEMASLLHDIGNPPFGHFAEQTINRWLTQNTVDLLRQIPANDPALQEALIRDITSFDGNAQAIRIVTKLQRLNLSYMQIASILKYTRGAFESAPDSDDTTFYLRKKPGFFYSEKNVVEKIRKSLDIEAYHRFPITYIMEAADDISYLSADLEDAVVKGILKLEEVYSAICEACEKEGEAFLLGVVKEQYAKAMRDEAPYRFNMFFTLMRAKLVRALVGYVSDRYIAHHEAIFEGSFDGSLLDNDSDSTYAKAIRVLRNVSIERIYSHKAVQTLEIQGYTIINALFDAYKPLLTLSSESFTKLLNGERIDCFISMRLIGRLSQKQIVSYIHSVDAIRDEADYELLERYYRIRLIIDYISGMTDDYALYEYREINAIG